MFYIESACKLFLFSNLHAYVFTESMELNFLNEWKVLRELYT